MTDVFLMHRAASTHEMKLRFALMQARADLVSTQLDLTKLSECHDELISSYIADSAVQREREKELVELRKDKAQHDRLNAFVADDLGPLIAVTMRVIGKMNSEISKWRALTPEGIPAHMPIDPEMANTFQLLQERLEEHVKVVGSAEEAAAVIAEMGEQ